MISTQLICTRKGGKSGTKRNTIKQEQLPITLLDGYNSPIVPDEMMEQPVLVLAIYDFLV
jgi:hypothetical protein